MQELEPTWGRVMSVWWLVLWRGVLGAMAFGAVFGFVFGFVGAIAGLTPDQISLGASIIGAVVGLPWAIVVVRMALRKQYSDFRIALVPRN